MKRPTVEPGDALLRQDAGVRRHLRCAAVLAWPVAALTVVQAFALAAMVVALAQEGRFDAVAAAVLVGAAAARGAVGWWLERSGRLAAAAAIGRLRTQLVGDAATLAAAAPGALRPGEVAADVVEQLPSIESYLGRFLSGRPAAAATTVVVLLAVASTDLLSAALLAPTVPILIVFLWLVGTEARDAADARLASLQLLGAHLLDVLRGLTDLRAFGRADHQRGQVAKAAANYRVQTMATLRAAFLSGLVLELVAMLGTALVAVFGGVRLAGGDASLAAILPALVLAPELYAPLRRLGAGYHEAADAKAALGRLAAVRALAAAAPVAGTPGGPAAPQPGGRTIVLDRVTVDGGGGGRAVDHVRGGADLRRAGELVHAPGGARAERLSDVSLAIEPGETIALVGPSGAGKTTLASLLLGLLPPTRGSIAADGVDLATVDLDAWRRGCAWVAQEPVLLPATLRENARLAAPEANDAAVLEALRDAGLAPLVAALPAGLDTMLGDGAALLSSGELRRLAMARAVLTGAELIVLDEPTAQLDDLTAQRLQGTIDRLRTGRTTLLITHDDALAATADRVVRLEGGRVIDIVDHQLAVDWDQSLDDFARLLIEAAAHAGSAAAHADPAAEDGSRRPAGSSLAAVDGMRPRTDEAAEVDGAGVVDVAQPSKPVDGVALAPATAAPLGLIAALRLLRPERGDRARRLARRAIGLGALSAASGVAVLAISGGLIVEASTRPPVLELTALIVLVRMFSILRSTARYGERLAGHDAALRVLEGVRVKVFSRLASTPGASTVAALDRAVGDVDRTADLLVRVVVPAGAAIATIGLAGLLAALFSVSAAAVIVGVGLVVGALIALAGRRAGRAHATATRDRGALTGEVVTALDAGVELLLAGRTADHVDRIAARSERLEGAAARQGAHGVALGAVVTTASAATAMLVALTTSTQVGDGALSGAVAAGLVLAGLAAIERLDGVADAALALPSAAGAVGRLQDALRAPDGVDATPDSGRQAAAGASLPLADDGLASGRLLTRGRIRATGPGATGPRFARHGAGAAGFGFDRGVALRVDGLTVRRGTRTVARDASFEVAAGERVAITGESGCGKSTLLLGLAGLVRSQSGRATSGAVDLLCATDAERAAAVLLVPSQPHLFGGSLAANLRLAAPTATDGQLDAALTAVGLGPWLVSLPEGLETLLGEGGATASGGQRQRIGLARAFLSPAPVVLLDEPASHLPEDAALQAIEAVITERPGRAAVIVSHRAAERRLAGRELRMHDGRLHGPPSEAPASLAALRPGRHPQTAQAA